MAKIIGGLIVAWGVLDFFMANFMNIDLYAEMGIEVPDSIYFFTPVIAGFIGWVVYSLGGYFWGLLAALIVIGFIAFS